MGRLPRQDPNPWHRQDRIVRRGSIASKKKQRYAQTKVSPFHKIMSCHVMASFNEFIQSREFYLRSNNEIVKEFRRGGSGSSVTFCLIFQMCAMAGNATVENLQNCKRLHSLAFREHVSPKFVLLKSTYLSLKLCTCTAKTVQCAPTS